CGGGERGVCGGAELGGGVWPEVRVAVGLPGDKVEAGVGAVGRAGGSGKSGDGKSFGRPVEQASRIRTGGGDEGAL
ncbi:P-II family nitrogen regulator, partial [Achromobacter ruhlandii]